MCADIAVHSMELRILKNINWEYLSKIKTWHHLNYCIWRPWIRQEYINFNECNKPSTNHPKNKSKNQQYVQYRKIIATIEFTDRTDPPTLVAIKKTAQNACAKGPMASINKVQSGRTQRWLNAIQVIRGLHGRALERRHGCWRGKKQLPGLSCWLVMWFMWLYMLAHCVLWLPQQSSRKSLIRFPYKDTRVFVSIAKMRFSFRCPKRKVEHINKVHASLDIETNIRRICIG